MTVPLQDPAREYRARRDAIDAAVGRVTASGQYVLGPEVEALEEEVADYLGAGHAVAVGSGTDALVLILRGLGIGEGDEVVIPPFTFFATAEAVLRVGARPVFADIRGPTFNMDPAAARAAVTPRTAALLPVHLFGQMADVGELRRVADRHGLALVEDAAQALGADRRMEGSRVRPGAAGDAAAFSFYPTKNLAALGDGGMVVADDAELASRVRRLRDHGRESGGGGHRETGYNSRLDALQAAVLRAKLPRLDEWNGRRRRHARAYDDALAESEVLRAPPVAPGSRHVYHQYTLRCPHDREALGETLDRHGVGHGIYYPEPLHRMEALRGRWGGDADLPEGERAAREVLSLPVFPHLRDDERDRVLGALRDFAG